jgi:hypothetical protein
MPTTNRRTESGFALILAILALLLLTFLGLTLTATTSTEMQIANNYRYAQQALYNAEAGLAVGQRELRTFASWLPLLPGVRPIGGMGSLPGVLSTLRPGTSGEQNRSFENSTCDGVAGQGYGLVLDVFKYTAPFQNFTTYLGQPSLQGTFTLWVRRKTLFDNAGQAYDDTSNTDLIMTSEGTAPYVIAGTTFAGTVAQTNRARRILETTVHLRPPCDEEDSNRPNADVCNPV